MLHIKVNRSASLPVELEDADGKISKFELREMKQSARERYLDSVRARGTSDDKGVFALKKLEGLHADLLCLCLYHGDSAKLISREFADDLPVEVSTQLYQEAQKINGLGGVVPQVETKN